MKSSLIKILAITGLIVWFISADLSASHVAGGQLSYRCLGNGTYEITLEFRRDCFNGDPLAQFDDPVSIGIFDKNGNIIPTVANLGELFIQFNSDDTLNEIQTSECKIIGPDVCVQTTTYRRNVNLPFRPGGYILAYQRCCRNNSVTNIIDPTFQGSTYWVEITATAQQQCNSSADFNSWPSVYLCANDELVFDHSATDADGDSLVYSLCAPYIGATPLIAAPQPPKGPPYNTVIWAPPFNLDNLMGGVPLEIDSETGIITATPNALGQFLVGVCVEEYRNGVLINRVIRDFEYNVRICLDNPIADFTTSTDQNCEGLDISFMNTSAEAGDYLWLFDYPDTTLNSTEENPTFTYPEGGVYEVALFVNTDDCVDSSFATVAVSLPNDPALAFDFEYIDCLDSLILFFSDTISSTQEVTDTIWTITGQDTIITINGDLDSIVLPGSGMYNINLYAQTISGCDNELEGDYDLQLTEDEPEISFSVDYVDCLDSLVVYFTDTITAVQEIINVQWTITGENTNLVINGELDSLELIHAGTYTFTLFAETIEGCNTTVSQTLDFVLTPIDFEVEPEEYFICDESTIVLNENADSQYTYMWTSDPPGILIDPTAASPEVTVDTNTTFFVVASFGNCDSYDTVNVVPMDLEVFTINTIEDQFFFCEGGSVLLEAEATAIGAFTWYNEQDEVIGTGTPFTFFPQGGAEELYVIATNSIMCSDTAYVNITPYGYNGEIIGNDLICLEDIVSLEIINDDDPLQSFIYEWQPENLIVGGSGTQVDFQLDGDTQVTVEVTNQEGCVFTIDYLVMVDPFEELEVTVEPNNILLLESTQLNVDDLPGATYEWTPPGTLDDPTISNPIATPDDDGIVYTVTVTNENGCTATASVTVDVMLPNCDETDIFVPNMFSPNGDNFNDEFKPVSNFVEAMELIIYSRWGEEVFRSNDINNGWDGTFNGVELEPDVYGYYLTALCIDGNTYTKKGNVTIIK